MYKAIVNIEIEGDTYEAVKEVASKVHNCLSNNFVHGQKYTSLEVSYEKDGEYLDHDESI